MRVLTMQCVSDELGYVVGRKRRENDLAHHGLCPANSIQRLHQGVRRTDFVVAKRSDEEKSRELRHKPVSPAAKVPAVSPSVTDEHAADRMVEEGDPNTAPKK